MIEYLYDCIRATAGNDVDITAIIQDATGAPITEHCHIMLFDKEQKLLATFDGNYIDDGFWSFTIPATETEGKCGRYWYRICTPQASLCFTQPIYFCV